MQIDFWFAGNATGIAAMQTILDGFNSSQDAYLVVERVFGGYDEIYSEVQRSIATGGAPDVVVLERDASRELFQKGLTMDLTQALTESPQFKPRRYVSVYYDQGVTEDGRIYAMPLYGTTQVMYYNKQAFADAGIDITQLDTWQDYAKAALRLQEAGYDYGWEPMWGYENMVDAVFSNGGKIFSSDGRTCEINSPAWVEVWESFRQWIHETRSMRIHAGGYGWEYWAYTQQDVLEGRAGGYTGSSGDQADVDFAIVGMLEQPTWEGGLSQARPSALALLLNVLSTSPANEQAGALALIRYLIDVPAQVQWTIGTGYIAINRDVRDDATYLAYIAENEYADIPLTQSMHATVYPNDPTGGVLRQALVHACDQVQIENIPAQLALDEAQSTVQAALDKIYNNNSGGGS